MRSLDVSLSKRSYPVLIGAHLLDSKNDISSRFPYQQILIVSNPTVAQLYLNKLQMLLSEEGKTIAVKLLPDGEQYKKMAYVEEVFSALLELGFNRDCVLVALGGGVIGDMTGFAAACYQRGVDFIQVPTTLLAQVDSSVGGKTGVNHPLGKNMIGAFKQPKTVIIDIATLDTLSDRELSAGLAEVIKYGLIRDAGFLDWIESNLSRLIQRDHEALAEAVYRSCQNKAEVVAADEFENDQRALLNFGHTFGHAIETAMGYGVWLHGEAVGAGMMMAARLSARLGWLSALDLQRIEAILLSAGLPVLPPAGMTVDQFVRLMALDKKVKQGQLRLVLLKSLGEAVVTADFPMALLKSAIYDDCTRSTGE